MALVAVFKMLLEAMFAVLEAVLVVMIQSVESVDKCKQGLVGVYHA